MSETSTPEEILRKCSLSTRLNICTNLYIKAALLDVLHNRINEKMNKVPDDPRALYRFLQKSKEKIQKSHYIRKEQKSILLPINGKEVKSDLFDISLIRYVIQTFCGINNANNDWGNPDLSDKTLCAYVSRAATFRNEIFHNNNVDKMDVTTFEKKWNELKDILQGLKYDKDIDDFKTATLEKLFPSMKSVIKEEFIEHLKNFKEECLKEPTQENYIQRRFYVDGNKKEIVIESDLENIIKENECVVIYAEGGMGKTSIAKQIRNEWCRQNILKGTHLLYFDSKKMNKRLSFQSHAAPLSFSELGEYLKEKNEKTDYDLSIYRCVKTRIESLVILIDGIDEFPVKDLPKDYFEELEKKVKNNEEITSTDTIMAIYFGFLFPNSKVILLGRIGEFDNLKKVKVRGGLAIFNRKTRYLKLLEFDKQNIKEFACLQLCKQPSQKDCIGACKKINEEIINNELCKIPTDLKALIDTHLKKPKEDIGNVTRTKLIIGIILNRLTNHVQQENISEIKTFYDIKRCSALRKYLECIRNLAEISFESLLKSKINVEVEEKQDVDDIAYFHYADNIKIDRKILEELDLFYVRDYKYNSILEPHHTLNMEFLSNCHLFSQREKWNSILDLSKDRQIELIRFIAGLNADNYFTKDFVENVLATNHSFKDFINWLFEVEDIRNSLPNGGVGYDCWYGLMENKKLSPSFYTLDFIFREVENPKQNFISTKTIVCFDDSFEWYNMDYLNHYFLTKCSDEFNIDLFLNRFPSFDFIIKGNILINNNSEFNRLNQCRKKVIFRTNELKINTSIDTCFTFYSYPNTLSIPFCDSRTIDPILNSLSPSLKCKQLRIENTKPINAMQIEKLFGLSCFVDYIELQSFTFLTDENIKILENVERNSKKLINIELWDFVEFNRIFALPNLGNRHISLYSVYNVTNDHIIEFKQYISPGDTHNLTKYKIIDHTVPFVRKDNPSQDRKQSMYLNLYSVNFERVSPEIFAETFSKIPSLACLDNRDIPTSHWLKLSQTKGYQINEVRIWEPQSRNFQHFLNLKSKVIQFIGKSKNYLKELLNCIVNESTIQLDKEIKVFVVEYDDCDWDYYDEITLFGKITIEDYQNNHHSSLDSRLDNVCVPFHEGEKHLKLYCCEILLPSQKNNMSRLRLMRCKLL